MRLIETASKWGNLYNFRYFANGVRISYNRYVTIMDTHKIVSRTVKDTSYGFRVVFIMTPIPKEDLY